MELLHVLAAGFVQVFGRRDDGLSTRSCGRRPKSAKARNRVMGAEAVRGRLYVADCLANEQILLSSEENGEPVWALGA